MYKELVSDIAGFKMPDHGYLMGWAKQGGHLFTIVFGKCFVHIGVLLLNACLTVRAHQPNSHQGKVCTISTVYQHVCLAMLVNQDYQKQTIS